MISFPLARDVAEKAVSFYENNEKTSGDGSRKGMRIIMIDEVLDHIVECIHSAEVLDDAKKCALTFVDMIMEMDLPKPIMGFNCVGEIIFSWRTFGSAIQYHYLKVFIGKKGIKYTYEDRGDNYNNDVLIAMLHKIAKKSK